jgi:hypothetical protein
VIDAAIFDQTGIRILIEFKKYIGKEPRTETKQLDRYASLGYPVFLVKRDHDLNDVLKEVIDFLSNEAASKYRIGNPPKSPKPTRADWERLAKLWPRSDGRTEGVNRLCERYKTWADHSAVESGLRGALRKYAHEKTDPKYIPHFSTIIGTEKAERWKDTVDWKPATAPRVSAAPPPGGIRYDGSCAPPSTDSRPDSAEERKTLSEQNRELLAKFGIRIPSKTEQGAS